MREDMFKVIVERPRRGMVYSRDGRKYRNSEDIVSFLGMKEGYSSRKYLNENLRPLKRYLDQQINRPWNKVYSDIRATIDPRHTVKQHILEHLNDIVAINARWEEFAGVWQVMVQARFSDSYVPLDQSRHQLFVHPRTGILLRNRRYLSYSTQNAKKRQAQEKAKQVSRRIVSDTLQLHCIDGIWYCVDVAVLPAARAVWRYQRGEMVREMVCDSRWDVLRQQKVSRDDFPKRQCAGAHIDCHLYGDKILFLYGVEKKQLNSRELQSYELLNPAAKQKGPKRAFLFCSRSIAT